MAIILSNITITVTDPEQAQQLRTKVRQLKQMKMTGVIVQDKRTWICVIKTLKKVNEKMWLIQKGNHRIPRELCFIPTPISFTW